MQPPPGMRRWLPADPAGFQTYRFYRRPCGRRAGLPDRRPRQQRVTGNKKKARKQPESKEREGNHPDIVSQIARRGAHNPKTLGPKSAGARTACAATTCQSLNSATYSAGCCTNPGHKPRQRYLIPALKTLQLCAHLAASLAAPLHGAGLAKSPGLPVLLSAAARGRQQQPPAATNPRQGLPSAHGRCSARAA